MTMIIGVVGQIASGKSVLVNYLTSHHNFTSFSLSSIVHEELKRLGIKNFTRETLQDIGDELRKREGNEVLTKRAIDLLNLSNMVVIEGIRNPGEIEFLKKNSSFILIGVKAKQELRFKRLLFRNKKWDLQTYQEFLKVDRRDNGVGQKNSGQQVRKCLAYCDLVITNNKDVLNFQRKVQKSLIPLLKMG